MRPSAPRPVFPRRRETGSARPRVAIALIVSALLAPGAQAQARPPGPQPAPEIPPTLAPGEIHISPYLAYYKARALSSARARRMPMTANQQAYDARYYSLDLHPDPSTHVLTGTVRMLASVVSGPLTALDLDLDSTMTVDATLSAGNPAAFTHASDVLTVQLDRAYAGGETMDVTVQYHGTPAPGAFGGPFAFATHGGQPMIWTISEPYGAHAWWPCKDQPSDKADSVDVRVTVPTGMRTSGNGVLVEESDDGSVAFTHWHERFPIATYLVSLTSYAYATSSDWYRYSPTDSMEIKFFMFPEHATPDATVNSKVKSMIGAFSARLGPYPFLQEKYGEAECLLGGGMENQTCTSLGVFSEYVVAHELSHDWFGDQVTCRDFQHIWLNEGFAHYCEALWAEANGGLTAYHQYLAASRYYGAGSIFVPDTTSVDRIFDSNLTYDKASWVLHMLRHVMGDTLFFTALRSYQQQHQYGTAVTEDLQQACEAVSGLDLSRFFQEWIYGEYFPSYRVTYVAAPAGGGYDVSVQVQQTQSGQLFWMPVDVAISSAGGDSTFVVRDSLDVQTFTFHMPAAPISVALDPDEWILRQITYPTAVGEPQAAARLRLLPPSPNPSHGTVEIAYSLPRPGAVRVVLLDAAGRRVVELQRGELGAGLHRLTWDQTDAAGREVGGGIYWVCLEQGGIRRTQKLAIVR